MNEPVTLTQVALKVLYKKKKEKILCFKKSSTGWSLSRASSR